MKNKEYNGSGELLGEGSYGCVYKKNNNIIKILFDNEKFIKEVMRTLLINKIDKNITSTRIEDIKSFKLSDIKDKDLLNDLDKCNLIKRKNLNVKNIYEIIYNIKYFGTDLYEISKTNIITLDKILALSLRLYEALELYNGFKVLHSDIKPDNILYLKENDTIVFIDFGLLKTYDDVLFDNKLLNHTYFYYPPEFKLIISLIKNENIQQFTDNFLLNINRRSNYGNILLENYKDYNDDLINLYKRYYENYNNKIKVLFDTNIEALTNEYKNELIEGLFNDEDKDKLDLYGLSISIYEIIMLYLYNNKNLIEDPKFILDYINNIIMPSINFDNNKRASVRETINNFKKLKHKNKDINNILKQMSLKKTIEIYNENDVSFNNKLLNKNYNKTVDDNPVDYQHNKIDGCRKNKRVYLLKIAKEKNIKYRHKMNKDILCKNIEKDI